MIKNSQLLINIILGEYYSLELWWLYIAAVGFILWGGYYLKLWKRKRNSKASIEEKAYGEWFYLVNGIFLVGCGIMILVMPLFIAISK